MPSTWMYSAAAAMLMAASAVHLDSSVNINPGNVTTTAAAFKNHECSQGGGPYADKDVWVFVLPGNTDTSGDFVSVTAKFDTNNDGNFDTTLVIPTDGGGIINGGGGNATSKAYIATAAGWTLITASAIITGTADFFNLTHTCPAGTSTSPSPDPSPDPSESPSTDTSSSSSSSSSSGGGTPPDDSGQLPVTGAAVGGIAVTGLVFIVAGVAMLALRRRRDDAAALAEAGPDDRAS
jgi:hypothetical protein